MPYPFMPCRQATPEAALWPFQGYPAGRAAYHHFGHPMPYAYVGFYQFNNKEPTWSVRSRAKLKITVKKKIGRV
jgi:hypothetical protein